MRVTSKGAANLSEVKFLRNIHIYKITSQYARFRKGMR